MNTQTNVNVDSTVKTETVVDPKLVKLYGEMVETQRKGEVAAGGKYVAVVKYVIDANLSRASVVKSLESLGNMTESTVQTTASRIMALTKPENAHLLKALEEKTKTVREVRKEIVKPQVNPRSPKSTEAKLASAIATVIAHARVLGLSVGDVQDKLSDAWNKA